MTSQAQSDMEDEDDDEKHQGSGDDRDNAFSDRHRMRSHYRVWIICIQYPADWDTVQKDSP